MDAPEGIHHRVQCAAIVNGCTSTLMWTDHTRELLTHHLIINGWRLDHGEWVCAQHE